LEKRDEFVLADEEEMKREEIESQLMNLKYISHALKYHTPNSMNDEDQTTEQDRVLEVNLYLQSHEGIYSNIEYALVLSSKIDTSDRVSCELLEDHSTIKEKELFKENSAKYILCNSHENF
jgi:hypothetical protein